MYLNGLKSVIRVPFLKKSRKRKANQAKKIITWSIQ